MNNRLSHFAIYADNMSRAQMFYESVFEWSFNSYGPPGFLQIKVSDAAGADNIGALQSSNYSPVPEKIKGFECTIGVSNIDEMIERIVKNGGTIVMPKTQIPQVGWIVKFLDTEGNLVCAMEYQVR